MGWDSSDSNEIVFWSFKEATTQPKRNSLQVKKKKKTRTQDKVWWIRHWLMMVVMKIVMMMFMRRSFEKCLDYGLDIELLQVSVRLATTHEHNRCSRYVNHRQSCSNLQSPSQTLINKTHTQNTYKNKSFYRCFIVYLVINGIELRQ